MSLLNPSIVHNCTLSLQVQGSSMHMYTVNGERFASWIPPNEVFTGNFCGALCLKHLSNAISYNITEKLLQSFHLTFKRMNCTTLLYPIKQFSDML